MIEKERWVIYEHENSLTCPCCGDVIEVKTNLSQEDIDQNIYLDGDIVRCVDADCDLENAQIMCDEESAFVNGDW